MLDCWSDKLQRTWTPKLHHSIAALLLSLALLTSLAHVQAAAPEGVKVSLDRYQGSATLSASRDELPATLFDRLDTDKDEFVTEEEAKALSKPRL